MYVHNFSPDESLAMKGFYQIVGLIGTDRSIGAIGSKNDDVDGESKRVAIFQGSKQSYHQKFEFLILHSTEGWVIHEVIFSCKTDSGRKVLEFNAFLDSDSRDDEYLFVPITDDPATFRGLPPAGKQLRIKQLLCQSK